MLRKIVGVLAVLVVMGGNGAYSDGWPGPTGRAGATGCASCGGGQVGGWVDESPLYPELAHWIFERSQCRQLHGQGGHHWRQAVEIPSFPPLPYSVRANGYPVPAPAAAAAPAQATVSPPPAEVVPPAPVPAPAPAQGGVRPTP
jgi:hypothetical protein